MTEPTVWISAEEVSEYIKCSDCDVRLFSRKRISGDSILEVMNAYLLCNFCSDTMTNDYIEDIMDADTGATWDISYREYLKTKQWSVLRRHALEAASKRCQVCNSDLMLQVHHRKYPDVLGFEQPSDLTVLCRRCHDLFHDVTRKGSRRG